MNNRVITMLDLLLGVMKKCYFEYNIDKAMNYLTTETRNIPSILSLLHAQ